MELAPVSNRPAVVESQTDCLVCGRSGPLVYEGIDDRHLRTTGSWNIRSCHDCKLMWLDPRYAPSEISRAYQASSYYTHKVAGPPGFVERVKASRFGAWVGYVNFLQGFLQGGFSTLAVATARTSLRCVIAAGAWQGLTRILRR